MSQTMKQPVTVTCHCGDVSVYDGNWLVDNWNYHCNNGHTDPIPDRDKILMDLRTAHNQEVKMKRRMINKGATLTEANDAVRQVIADRRAEAA